MRFLARVFFFASFMSGAPLWAAEGMWLYNALPVEKLQAEYGFTPDAAWADHLMKSSVRLETGGSGSFVSADGLLLTNHHVAAPTLQAASDATHNYFRDGVLAKTRSEEIKAKHLEVRVLQSIEDVTARVQAAAPATMDPAVANQKRKVEIAAIENEAKLKTGLEPEVVTLYNNGRFHLYNYKTYTDVRIVWAPEYAMGTYGGDYDNFNFPRFALDAALFRVYENDQPIKTENFLKIAAHSAQPGDLVFVSGHPGHTNRADTFAQMQNSRSRSIPLVLSYLKQREIMLQQYRLRGKEQARQALEDLKGMENSRKLYDGLLASLLDPQVVRKKAEAEEALREKVLASPELKAKYASAWDEISVAIQAAQPLRKRYLSLERARAFDSELFTIARTIVRIAAEDPKPLDERLPEYADARRANLLETLYSNDPLYSEFEQFKLEQSLIGLQADLGPEDPLVLKIMAGKNPKDRAAQLITLTRIGEIGERKRLVAAGAEMVEGSADPMIQLARDVDDAARAVRKEYEDKVEGPIASAQAKIAAATFAVYGDSSYPDATFTLRLAYGEVKGWTEGGKVIPAQTTIGGAFQHETDHDAKDPYELPPSWHTAKDKLDPNVALNLVSTNDIIGGNSGSPLVNRAGELVGLIFDGNLPSLAGDYIFDGTANRAVSVDARGIVELLNKVYHADALLTELGVACTTPQCEQSTIEPPK